ncbi:MAG: DUF6320 domain-containing protein [Bacteroidales bacterium]|nr:DUF6320 domain-containing protein [Bacteroidales bacterium]
MSYCVNCGVELEASLRECPLCHTPVINPNEAGTEFPPSPYPENKGQVEEVKRKDLGILLSVVLTATSGTCLLLNLLVFNKSLWSLLVIGICICLFVFTFPLVYYRRTPLALSLLADGASVALYLYLISRLTPSADWFLQLGLPTVALVFLCVEIFAFLLHKIPLSVLSGALCLFIEIPLFCATLELLIHRMLTNTLRLSWSAVVLTVCAIIDVALITILVKKRLRNEVRRRLHF